MRKKIISLLLAFGLALTCTACGGQKVDDKDPRPAIYVSVFNGGYGREWLDNIVRDYNTSHPENAYKIAVRSSKDEFTKVLADVQSGTAPYDMFYTNNYVYKLINGGYVEELSSVWDSKPDGTRTIREMMVGAEEYAAAYGDGKGGVYAIPHQESLRMFVYDHDLFLKYGLLFNEDGDFISSPTETLSKGKDGVQGTYDDGQPITEEQWESMAIKATQNLGYAFNYTSKFGMYCNTIYEMIAAQYDGVENYLMNWTFDGSYDFGNGETEITLNNGYMLSKLTGKRVAMEFMDKYLAVKDATLGIVNPYTYPSSSGLSYSHTDAQSDFITFTAKNKRNRIGMLVEGDWWENESKDLFNDLYDAGYTDYKFRTHNYRFMTLPLFEGQKESGSVYDIADNMYLCLLKKTSADKKAICKDFMTFAYKEQYIRNYTVISGGVMPYDVELSAEEKAQLSPFTKNFLELYQDREHNKFINTQLYANKYDTARAGIVNTASCGDYYVVINGLYYLSAEQYLTKMYNKRVSEWNTMVDTYETYMRSKV